MTVTLPERTLRSLRSVDEDLARAIVRSAEIAVPSGAKAANAVEVVEVSPGAAVILVPPSRCLARIPWLRLAEVSPGRHLLTIVPGTPVESLELEILDRLESLSADEAHEAAILESLVGLIRSRRRAQRISKFEILYVPPSRNQAA